MSRYVNLAALIALSLLLFAIDAFLGASATLYMSSPIQLVPYALILASAASIWINKPKLLFVLQNAAFGTIVLRNLGSDNHGGWLSFIGIVIGVNMLIWMIVRLRSRLNAA